MSTSALPTEHLAPMDRSWPALDTQRYAASMTLVTVAHGRRLVRAGLRVLLEREAGIVVIEAATGDEAVMVAQRASPDVVLMDLDLPGLGCVEATQRILADTSSKVMVLTTSPTDARVFATLLAGATGLVLEDREPAVLVRAVRRLHGGSGRDRSRRPSRSRPGAGTTTPQVIDISHRRGGR
jgi:DNA-binding NarL/FixJ family response regulator